MASVTGFTAARMLAIEETTIVDGSIVGNDLILEARDGTLINAGNVRGATGAPGVDLTSFNTQMGAMDTRVDTLEATATDHETRLDALDGGTTVLNEIRLRRSTSQALTPGGAITVSWNVEDSDPMGGITVPISTIPIGATLGAGMYMFFLDFANSGLLSTDVIRLILSVYGTVYNHGEASHAFGPIRIGAAETASVTIFTGSGTSVNGTLKFIAYRLGA